MAKAAAGVTTIPVSVTVQPGVRKDLPQAQIPAGVTHASFSLDASWFTDPTALLSWGADTSTDGATWSFFASGSRPGGRALGDGGVVVTTLDLGFTVTPGQFVRGFLLLTPGTQPQGPQPITGTLTLT